MVWLVLLQSVSWITILTLFCTDCLPARFVAEEPALCGDCQQTALVQFHHQHSASLRAGKVPLGKLKFFSLGSLRRGVCVFPLTFNQWGSLKAAILKKRMPLRRCDAGMQAQWVLIVVWLCNGFSLKIDLTQIDILLLFAHFVFIQRETKSVDQCYFFFAEWKSAGALEPVWTGCHIIDFFKWPWSQDCCD